MNKKIKKLLMTRVAKGEITEKEALDLIKDEKTHQKEPVQELKGDLKEKQPNTHKRKKAIKPGGK